MTSRQYQWARKRKEKGLCSLCAEPLHTKWHCKKHALDNKLRVQKSQAKKKDETK
jgi:hypothetical protein